jgi:hypothetical protein
MVFLTTYQGWKMEGTMTVQLTCTNCHNTSDHFVYVAPHGLQGGCLFFAKPIVGMRKHYLACPVCNWLAKEITKEQAEAMRSAK